MNIRAANPSDAQALFEAEVKTAEVPGQLVSRPEELSLAGMETRLRETRSNGCFAVAENDERLLGHPILEPMGLIAVQHVYRLTIVVHPGETGRGVGTTLLQYLQSWASSHPELHKIELLVRTTNVAAIRLYTRVGF